MYRAWLKNPAVASGVIRLPRDLDRSSLYTAVYSGPVMPWIDPVKEAEAWKIQIRGVERRQNQTGYVLVVVIRMMSNVGARRN